MPTLTFKVSPAEARAIRSQARGQKSTLSKFLRERALGSQAPAKRRKRVIKNHPLSGLPYDATDENGPMVTREQISACLADFP